MSFIDRALRALDLNVWWVLRSLGLNAPAYCQIEGVEGRSSLVTARGELVSVLELGGSRRMVSSANFDAVTRQLAEKVGSHLSGSVSHRMQFVFARDNGIEALDRELSELLEPSFSAARRRRIDVADVLSTRAVKLAEFCALERSYLVVTTTAAALSTMERRAAAKERSKALAQLPGAPDALRPAGGTPGLTEVHRALLEALRGDFSELKYHVRLLESAEALHVMRMQVDPEFTAPDWQPAIPGRQIARRPRAPEAGVASKDASNLLWPSIARQVFPRGAEPVDTRVLRIGDRLYQGISLSLPPEKVRPFEDLFHRLNDTSIPYRISFRLSGAGVDDVEIQLRHIASFFSTSRTVKKALGEAFEDKAEGYKRIGFQMDAVTWVEATDGVEDRKLLARAASRLARTIQGWGSCEVEENLGSPVTVVLSTVPGLIDRGAGPLAVPPVEDAMALLPLSRPASPWSTGPLLLRTRCGKLYPHARSRSVQTALVNLVFAPMGAGKSVLLNALNTALTLTPGNDDLPYIRILDIGASSYGHISLVQSALPESLRHQVVYRKLRNVQDDAINPCDMPLGMRVPLPQHRAFLVNFLSLLCTPLGESTPLPDVPSVIGRAIDEAYRRYAPEARDAHPYCAGVDPGVDAALDAAGLEVDHSDGTATTWWEVVDALFEAGDLVGASLAQRYAVPTLGEVAAACTSERVRSAFAGEAGGESVCHHTFRVLTEALREYPIISGATRFNLGAARIASLDLADVAPKGGAAAVRQTAVMYMLGRYVLTADFSLSEETLEACTQLMPAGYLRHHVALARRFRSIPKSLVLDEMHRATAAGPLILSMFENDIREGRKDNIEVTLASQLLEDFTPTMVNLATSIWIMGVGQKSADEAAEVFKLGPETAAVFDRIGKPTSAGASMLCIFETRSGRYVHELVLTLSPTELWAYNTNAEDREIRDALYGRLGAAAARFVLARAYPSGSAMEEIERRLHERARAGSFVDDTDGKMAVTHAIVEELVEMYQSTARSQAMAAPQDPVVRVLEDETEA